MASVTLVKFGQSQTVEVNEGETLADVLEREGIDSDATIRLRGESLSGSGLEVVLVPGDVVVAAPPSVDHGA